MTISELRALNNLMNGSGLRRKRNHPEHDMQCDCVNLFHKLYPSRLIYANANGGSRDVREAANLRREGVTAGVPDLSIPEPNGMYHGMYIEMKNGSAGRLSAAQVKMIDELRKRGYYVVVQMKRTM